MLSEITSRSHPPLRQRRMYTCPMTLKFPEPSFDSYDVQNRSSFAPFVQGRSAGIYIFEFANGQRYVGQTVNFARRFHSHIRGSSHHELWDDISTSCEPTSQACSAGGIHENLPEDPMKNTLRSMWDSRRPASSVRSQTLWYSSVPRQIPRVMRSTGLDVGD